MQLPGVLLPDLVLIEEESDPTPTGATYQSGTVEQARVRIGRKRVSSPGGGSSLTVVAAGTAALARQVRPGTRITFAATRYTVHTCTPHRPPVGGPAGDVAAWWEAVLV